MKDIGIIAHVDAGKTTLTERMLYLSGAVHRFGDVDDGTTVTDFGEQERERGITIQSAVVSMDWKGERVCVVDTPGHEDFCGEVVRCVNAIDGAVVVVSAVEGVEPQTERAWRRAEGVPKIVFVNKADRDGADFWKAVDGIGKSFGVAAVPMSEPVLDGLGRFVGVGAVARGEAWIDKLCSLSDVALKEYVEFGAVSDATVVGELKRLCAEGSAVPVWCGSAKTGDGVGMLMDGIIGVLPSPCESRPRRLASGSVGDGCFTGQVFKVSHGLRLMRVFTGSVRVGDTVEGFRGRKVRIQKMVDVQGRRQTDVAVASAGDIVGLCGLKDVSAGETLRRGCDAEYESADLRKPLVKCVVEPVRSSDRKRLEEAVASLCSEDATLECRVDEYGELVLSGLGMLQLDVALKCVEDEYGVPNNRSVGMSVFKCRPARDARMRTVCERSVGGKSARAEIECVFKVLDDGDSCEVAVPCIADRRLADSLRRGILDGMATGCNGDSMVRVSAEVVSASWSGDVPPDGILYMAGAECVDKAMAEVGVVALAPVVKADLWFPKQCLGAVSGWVSSRGADGMQVSGQGESVRMSFVIESDDLWDIGQVLPRLTGGRGDYSVEPCGWRDRKSRAIVLP